LKQIEFFFLIGGHVYEEIPDFKAIDGFGASGTLGPASLPPYAAHKPPLPAFSSVLPQYRLRHHEPLPVAVSQQIYFYSAEDLARADVRSRDSSLGNVHSPHGSGYFDKVRKKKKKVINICLQ
jgi:hypothetical protein